MSIPLNPKVSAISYRPELGGSEIPEDLAADMQAALADAQKAIETIIASSPYARIKQRAE